MDVDDFRRPRYCTAFSVGLPNIIKFQTCLDITVYTTGFYFDGLKLFTKPTGHVQISHAFAVSNHVSVDYTIKPGKNVGKTGILIKYNGFRYFRSKIFFFFLVIPFKIMVEAPTVSLLTAF